jgi:hypothetical protein
VTRKRLLIAVSAVLGGAALLIPAASGAGPFHSNNGSTAYTPKINDSTGPTIQCTGAGVFTTTISAIVASGGSGVSAVNATDRVRVTAPLPGGAPGGVLNTIDLTDNDVAGSATFALPCPLPTQSTTVTFTFQPQNSGGQNNGTAGSVVATITNTLSQ